MRRTQHHPSDDARLLREGDPDAARRLREIQQQSARRIAELSEDVDEVDDPPAGESNGDPYAEYDAAVTGYRGEAWVPLVDGVVRALLIQGPKPGWATVTVEVRRLDGRTCRHELPIDLGRPDVVHALTVRVSTLLARLKLPCRGMLEVTLMGESDILGGWEGAVRTGTPDPWLRDEEERIRKQMRAMYRDQGRTLRRFERMILDMFGNSAEVITACALVMDALRGANIAPPSMNRPSFHEDLWRRAFSMFAQFLGRSPADVSADAAPAPSPQRPPEPDSGSCDDDVADEDVLEEDPAEEPRARPPETAWSRAMATRDAAVPPTSDDRGDSGDEAPNDDLQVGDDSYLRLDPGLADFDDDQAYGADAPWPHDGFDEDAGGVEEFDDESEYGDEPDGGDPPGEVTDGGPGVGLPPGAVRGFWWRSPS